MKHQVAVLGAFDAAVTHRGYLCVGFIQTPGPGERKGAKSAGVEGNWDISVANLELKRTLQPGMVNTVSTHGVDRHLHGVRLAPQGRKLEFIDRCHRLTRVVQRPVVLTGTDPGERRQHQGAHEQRGVALGILLHEVQQLGSLRETAVAHAHFGE